MSKSWNLWSVMLVAVSATVLVGCKPKQEQDGPPPMPEVTVSVPLVEDIVLYDSYPGDIRAIEKVDITARISGFLKTVEFVDGQYVKAGQLLFTIEPEAYQAARDAAAAQVKQAEAQVTLAEVVDQRMKQAWESRSVSEIDYISAQADKDAAEAGLLVAKSNLANAELNLSYTQVVTPIAGRMSRHLVSPGNLVGGSGERLLATVVSANPVHVYFNVDERSLLPYLHRGDIANLDRKDTVALDLKLQLADGSYYDEIGHIDYADNEVDIGTGTLTVRAVFQNDEMKLAPGLYAKVQVPQAIDGAVLVPSSMVQRDMLGSFVLVVNKDNVLERKKVEAGSTQENLQVIKSGLSKDDRVVIAGLAGAGSLMQMKIPVKAVNGTFERSSTAKEKAAVAEKTESSK